MYPEIFPDVYSGIDVFGLESSLDLDIINHKESPILLVEMEQATMYFNRG